MSDAFEQALDQYEEFAKTMERMAEAGLAAGADEVTLSLDGFAALCARFRHLVTNCRRLYEERQQALRDAERPSGTCPCNGCPDEYEGDGHPLSHTCHGTCGRLRAYLDSFSGKLADTVDTLTRERDEARRAAEEAVKREVPVCPCDRSCGCDKDDPIQLCRKVRLAAAYTSTGGTVPEPTPPSEPAQQFRCDWQPKPDSTFGLQGEEAQAGIITLSVTLCDDGKTYLWRIADIMKVWMIATGYEPSLPAAKIAAETALQKHEKKQAAK